MPKGDYERKRTRDGGAAVLSQLRAQDYGVQRRGRGGPDGMPEVSGRLVQQAERGERDRHQNESGGFRRNVSEFARKYRVVLKQRTGKSRETFPADRVCKARQRRARAGAILRYPGEPDRNFNVSVGLPGFLF